MRKILKLGFVTIVFVLLIGVLYNVAPLYFNEQDDGVAIGRITSNNRNTTLPEKKTMSLIASGDYMIHETQYVVAYDATTGSYDFNMYTQYIADIVSSADIAMVNFEGTIDDSRPLGGYPLFNAPIEVLEPLQKAGYNVISTSNNHSLDSRLEGVVTTLDALEAYGFSTFGTQREKNHDILVMDVKGIKVAFLSYSYGFNGLEAQYTSEEITTYLQPLDPIKIEQDLRKAEEMADFTVVYPHWGDEYHRQPNAMQVELAHNMVEWGADLVLGSHPHVIQPSEIIQKDGVDKFIIYSMGNFISNQTRDTVNNHYTEQGMMLEFQLSQEPGQEVLIDEIILHPTWVNKHRVDGVVTYHILPTEKFVEGGSLVDTVDASTLQKIRSAHQEIINQVGLEK